MKPWLVERFCIPPDQNAAFVKAMEDVLDVYHRPYDPTRPQVCLDETSKQLVEHTRVPIAASRGRAARVDDEYKRCGTANIFAAVEPLTGRALVEATEHRTAVDMARFLRRLSDEAYREATTIVLVMDNLNIHDLSCLYEAFEPAEARRLVERFEVHHTPKHGSWLDVAEIFLSIRAWMAHGALSRRLLHLRCIAPGEVGPESWKAFALVERAQRECAA